MSNVRTSEEISRFDSLNIHICIHPQMALTLISLLHDKERPHITVGTAGVVVSCKIPILATRVRFPGSATDFCYFVVTLIFVPNNTSDEISGARVA